MKIEINNDNKVRFFAQYWGQNVFVNPILSDKPVSNTWVFDDLNTEGFNDEYLELKSLSEITNEDAVELASVSGYPAIDKTGKYLARHISNRSTEVRVIACDFLRSKGYAVTWMGLSVEELVAAGWIKLKERKND